MILTTAQLAAAAQDDNDALANALFETCAAGPRQQAKAACKTLIERDAKLPVPTQGIDGVYKRLGFFSVKDKEYAAAENYFVQGLRLAEKDPGINPELIAGHLGNLGALYQLTGRPKLAVEYHERALAIEEKVFADQPAALFITVSNLARAHRDQGHLDKAAELLVRARSLKEKERGSEHSEVLPTLTSLAEIYLAQRRFHDAVLLLERVCRIQEHAQGPEHPKLITALTKLASAYQDEGQFDAAVAPLRRARHISELISSPNHALTATVLFNLGVAHRQQGLLVEAGKLLERALAMAEKAVPPNYASLAATLLELGSVHKARGQLDTAAKLLKRALANNEKVPHLEKRALATSMANLAAVYQAQGRPNPAIRLVEQARTLLEKSESNEYSLAAATLAILAQVYQDQAQLKDAAELLERAQSILQRALGPNHFSVGQIMSNLATVYQDQGRLTDSAALFEQAAKIKKESFGPRHASYATTLANLGVVYRYQGRSSEAAALLKQALDIQAAALGPNHIELAATLDNLASVYNDQERVVEAIVLVERARVIKKEALGINNPSLALTLNSLALLYQQLGRIEDALVLLDQAEKIQEKTLGTANPQFAETLGNFAVLRSDQGQLPQAFALAERARKIYAKKLGAAHPELVDTLLNLSAIALGLQQGPAAIRYLEDLLSIEEDQLKTSITEERTLSLLGRMRLSNSLIYALPLRHPELKKAAQLAMTTALLRKGRSQAVGTLLNATLSRSLTTPKQRTRFADMTALLARRSLLLDQGKQYQPELDVLRLQAQQIEQELAREVGIKSTEKFPNPHNVLALITPHLKDAVLVEIVLGMKTYPGPESPKAAIAWHYEALVMLDEAVVTTIDLGEKGEVERLVDGFLGRVGKPGGLDLEKAQGQAGLLYNQIFAKLEPALHGRRQIILAPDGALQMIPWGALYDGKQYIIDKYQIRYVNSGRDLIASEIVELPQPALVLADPNATLLGQDRLTSARQASLRIAEMLKVQAVTDDYATEDRLGQAKGPWVLHLAAHGSFRLPAESSAHGEFSRLPKYMGRLLMASPKMATPLPLISIQTLWEVEDAMHHSAIALTPGKLRQEVSGQDGWLTGDEVKKLDLRGTQLVTLLSCSSGQGGISAGQGSFGLRRAFHLAGAETVVSALWPIEEDAASLLLVHYYERLIANKGRAEAMEEAMIELRKRSPHPHYWAPFIVVGRHSPLRPPP